MTASTFSTIELQNGTLVIQSVNLVNTNAFGSVLRLGPFTVFPVGLADLYMNDCDMTTGNIGIGNFSASGARFQVQGTRLTTSVTNNFNPSFVES